MSLIYAIPRYTCNTCGNYLESRDLPPAWAEYTTSEHPILLPSHACGDCWAMVRELLASIKVSNP